MTTFTRYIPSQTSVVNAVAHRAVLWETNTDFVTGTLSAGLEISGTGAAAFLRLKALADNSNDYNFTTASEYTYSASEITVAGGKATLYLTGGASYDWPFTTSGDYTYDATKISISGGVATLKSQFYANWHLNEASGTNAADTSGNSRNGTTVGAPSWVAAKLNNGLQFNGTTQYVSCGDIAGFERTDSFSVECWFKTIGASDMIVISKMLGSGNYTGWEMYIGSGRVYADLFGIYPSSYLRKYTVATFNDNNWHHAVITYNGSSLSSGTKIYVDGSLQSTTTVSDTLSTTMINAANLQFAARNATSLFTGILDEIVIYGKELTSGEVTSRYNGGSGIEENGYSTTNPTITPTPTYAFAVAIDTFSESATKPSGSEIKYNLSSDGGSTWKYWTGSAWAVADGTYAQSNSVAVVNANILTLAASGTLNVKSFLNSNGTANPILDNIHISSASSYATGSFVVEAKNDIAPTFITAWLTATETVTKPSLTDVKYQHSEDSGSSYNGTWITAAQLQSALVAISPAIKTRIKWQLTSSNSSVTPEVDNLNITSSAGNATSGTWESAIFDSTYLQAIWKQLRYGIVTPSGTSITLTAKSGNVSADIAGLSYGSAIANGNDMGLEGRYFRLKATFVGTTVGGPYLLDAKAYYKSKDYLVVSP